MSNPEISGTLEIITGTKGSAVGVMALRHCFLNLLDDHTDSHFTGRLMKLVKGIYHMDREGVTGKRSIFFSKERPYLANIIFHFRVRNVDMLEKPFNLTIICRRIMIILFC